MLTNKEIDIIIHSIWIAVDEGLSELDCEETSALENKLEAMKNTSP